MNRSPFTSEPDQLLATQIDQVVEAFEAERAGGSNIRLDDFLPDAGDEHYREVLCELVRVDLELNWRAGRRKSIDDYLRDYPVLADDPVSLERIAREEYRVRSHGGESPSPEDYERRFAISTAHWPPPSAGGSARRAESSGGSPSVACQGVRETGNRFPQVGSTFLGFDLIEELGRGTFGRVYLARQRDLAQRPVALKVTTATTSEPDKLALLQHTNIVPIHSVHRCGDMQAVCMPFFGRTTLADVLGRLQSQETLPASAEAMHSTVRQAPRQDRIAARAARSNNGDQSLGVKPIQEPSPESLAPVSFVEGCLGLARDLAAGLAHAHARGLVHRDLKPANILIADDGRPMILDFGLAQTTSVGNGEAGVIGGTLPYMAPEHLKSLLDGTAVEPAADIYSLGVILYQLLTGHVPFPTRSGPFRSAVPQMIADRREQPPSVRRGQAVVPRAVDAIVQKCLAPEPDRRYRSAAELGEDLQRQLSHQPLLYAADSSWRERMGKWARRHPRLASGTSIVAVATTVVVLLGILWYARGERIANLEAATTAQLLHDQMPGLRVALTAREMTAQRLDEAQRQVEQALVDLAPADDREWKQHGPFARLSAAEQDQTSRDVGEAMYLLAQAGWRHARELTDEPRRNELLQRALAWSAQSEAAFGVAEAPRAVRRQQAKLQSAIGRQPREKDDAAGAEETSADPFDQFLAAIESMGQREYKKALPILRKQCSQDPQDFSTWVLLGQCLHGLGEVAEAESVFTLCVALKPQSDAPYYRRGLARLDQKKHQAAADDFSEVLRLRDREYHARFNRGLARAELRDWRGAESDLTEALRLGAPQTRIYFERARVRLALGDRDGAAADRREGLARVPTDDGSWVARGFARLESAPAEAASDFAEALKLNDQSTLALANLAYLQAERLSKPDEAVRTLDKLVAVRSGDASSRVDRGVVLARLGRREPALEDARAVLAARVDPRTTYKAACIFALTSKLERGDAARALELLADALRRDANLAKLAESDADLANVRGERQFQALIAACATLRPELNRSRTVAE